jgi:hypothetical protein
MILNPGLVCIEHGRTAKEMQNPHIFAKKGCQKGNFNPGIVKIRVTK